MIPSQADAAKMVYDFYRILQLAYPENSDEKNMDTAKRCADLHCDKIIAIAPKIVQVEYQSIKIEIDSVWKN